MEKTIKINMINVAYDIDNRQQIMYAVAKTWLQLKGIDFVIGDFKNDDKLTVDLTVEQYCELMQYLADNGFSSSLYLAVDD